MSWYVPPRKSPPAEGGWLVRSPLAPVRFARHAHRDADRRAVAVDLDQVEAVRGGQDPLTGAHVDRLVLALHRPGQLALVHVPALLDHVVVPVVAVAGRLADGRDHEPVVGHDPLDPGRVAAPRLELLDRHLQLPRAQHGRRAHAGLRTPASSGSTTRRSYRSRLTRTCRSGRPPSATCSAISAARSRSWRDPSAEYPATCGLTR